VERELARLERARAGLDAIEAIQRAGGAAHWHQVDLTDPDGVAGAVGAVLEASGRVDVLLHCAGMEISHFLPDKPQREYDLVFDVKADGWLHLLHALGERLPRSAVVFSSIAGRFATPARRTTPPPTTCSASRSRSCGAVGSGALRSTGRPGRRSGWRAAARSRR
jgi:NAD(P)-dependent dehydrogenase (short-subunit alcohol dehydrogenase family)